MNTAPQDDFSGDLARDLGGWSDDALLKELSRRTTITTDADHELISTGAGLHLQHRQTVSSPLKVTYTPPVASPAADGYWTITVTGLRWTSAQNPTHPDELDSAQGVFGDKTWIVTDDGITSGTIYIGYAYRYTLGPQLPPTTTIRGWFDALVYTATTLVPDDTTDQVTRDGNFNQLASVSLTAGGAYAITSGIETPHVTYRNYVPGDHSHLWYDSDTKTLYAYALGRDDIATLDIMVPAFAPSLVIPDDTEDIVVFGLVEGDTEASMRLRGDSGVDWKEANPLQLGKIKTDSSGALVWLKPFTDRLHYRQVIMPRFAMGRIKTKITANEYTVDVYEDGLFDDAGSANTPTEAGATAYIDQIHADGIPVADEPVVYLLRFNDHWEMQVPVWL